MYIKGAPDVLLPYACQAVEGDVFTPFDGHGRHALNLADWLKLVMVRRAARRSCYTA
ncbi:hypothetical protein ACFQDL_25000 [Marinobacterium aestuariivivens]|uniref:Transposase DDE domain-containing protein n=1 Tax=Marinobacterium aestuariivivens TaxID=1698799 RepID=A0ABW2A654_9GAMM